MLSANGMHKGLADRFILLCTRLRATSLIVADSVFDDLITRYQEPSRIYHNIDHVAACLREFDTVNTDGDGRDMIEWALWFHDAIYDSRAKDNEARSADLAASASQRIGTRGLPDDDVRRLILATCHSIPAQREDERLVVDIDLSILGQPEDVFDQYDRAIREEYAWVADAEYRQGRTRVLRSFLDRRSIYSIPHFVHRYESHARVNLGRALARLNE